MNEEIDMMAGRFLRLSDCVKVYKNSNCVNHNHLIKPMPDGFKADVLDGMTKADLGRKYKLSDKVVYRLYDDVVDKYTVETGQSHTELLRFLAVKLQEHKSAKVSAFYKNGGNNGGHEHMVRRWQADAGR